MLLPLIIVTGNLCQRCFVPLKDSFKYKVSCEYGAFQWLVVDVTIGQCLDLVKT